LPIPITLAIGFYSSLHYCESRDMYAYYCVALYLFGDLSCIMILDLCVNYTEFVIVAGGTMYAAVTDIAFIDPSRTVWYEITGICSGLSFLCK